MIDPLETIITWLATALTSVSGRVAGKHRYGNGWTESQTGVSVHFDGGAPELYAPVHTAGSKCEYMPLNSQPLPQSITRC